MIDSVFPPSTSASAARVIPISQRPPLSRGELKFDKVAKRFANGGLPAIENITFTCRGGEFVVLVGPSGSGKSTILNIAAGMAIPDEGSITLDGAAIRTPGPDRAMVFQDHALFPWLDVEDNVAFGLRMAGDTVETWKPNVERALQDVGLLGARRKWVHELSGGMRQRVAIARALVMDPAVLLMDEPFAALDAQTRTLLHAHLQDLWCVRRATVLFVTHSVGEAARLADRIIILGAHPGRVIREVRVDLPHPRSFDSVELMELVKEVRGEIEREVDRTRATGA